MPRPLTPEQQADYARHRAFVLALSEAVDDLVRESPPVQIIGVRDPDGVLREREVPRPVPRMAADITSIVEEAERKSPAWARSTVRSMLPDLLEMTRHLGPQEVRRVDEAFVARGVPTLSGMRTEVWQAIPKVLRRGRIRTRAEYDLLIERLNDVDDPEFSREERERMGRMIEDFEARRVR